MTIKNTKLGGAADWIAAESMDAADLNDTFDVVASANGYYKYATATFSSADTSQKFVDTFVSTTSMITIEITSGTTEAGLWTVVGTSGSFTITSTDTETNDITFNYFVVRNVRGV